MMSARPLSRHSWDAVRSQITAQMARIAPVGELTPPLRDVPQTFSDDATEAYYGPTGDARAAINRILTLEPGAGQAEWEAATAMGANLDLLVDALAGGTLDAEARSAVALLLLDSIDRMAGSCRKELVTRIRWQLHRDGQVQARMRYWWTHMDGSAPVMAALN